MTFRHKETVTSLIASAQDRQYVGTPRCGVRWALTHPSALIAASISRLYRTIPLKRVTNDFESHSSRSTREPEHFHFSRGVSRVQKHRHAVVDGEGFQCSRLARPQIFFWKGSISRSAHRHDLRVSRDAGVSRMGHEALQAQSHRQN